MDYEEYFRAVTYDSLSEEINGLKIEISRLMNREFDLECEVERLTKTLELIAKEMPYDSWLHTLIKDVIGFEKWQAKEMIE